MGSEGLRGVAADKLGWEKLFSQKFERNCRPEICFAWKQDLCLQEVSKERRSSREKNLFGIYLPSRSEVTELGLGRQSQIQRWLKNCIQLDSNAVSLFVWNWLSWQIVSVSDYKTQITILILRRGALSRQAESLLEYPMKVFWRSWLDTEPEQRIENTEYERKRTFYGVLFHEDPLFSLPQKKREYYKNEGILLNQYLSLRWKYIVVIWHHQACELAGSLLDGSFHSQQQTREEILCTQTHLKWRTFVKLWSASACTAKKIAQV